MKVFKVKMPEAYAYDRMEWCLTQFGTPVKDGNWWSHRGHLYFRKEKDYAWYKLTWS